MLFGFNFHALRISSLKKTGNPLSFNAVEKVWVVDDGNRKDMIEGEKQEEDEQKETDVSQIVPDFSISTCMAVKVVLFFWPYSLFFSFII